MYTVCNQSYQILCSVVLIMFEMTEICFHYWNKKGHAVEQLVEALRYKPEGRGFDSRWCHWIFFH